MGVKQLVKSIIRASKKKEMVPIICPVSNDRVLEGKTALVLGGTGGIGLAIAEELHKKGCNIIIGGTNREKLSNIQNGINQQNWRTLEFNFTKPDMFKENIVKAYSFFDGLDILVCSSGVHTENVDFWNINSEEFSRVVDINLKGTYFACLEFARLLKEKGNKGHILVISSSRGSEPAWSPYGVSKWGLLGITEGFAKMLLPYGITVNAIAPGPTATGLIGFDEGNSIFTFENEAERLVMPVEVAVLASYLVSDASNMITGETIHISAGRGVIDIR